MTTRLEAPFGVLRFKFYHTCQAQFYSFFNPIVRIQIKKSLLKQQLISPPHFQAQPDCKSKPSSQTNAKAARHLTTRFQFFFSPGGWFTYWVPNELKIHVSYWHHDGYWSHFRFFLGFSDFHLHFFDISFWIRRCLHNPFSWSQWTTLTFQTTTEYQLFGAV